MINPELWQPWLLAMKHSGPGTWALGFGALVCAAFAYWAAGRQARAGDAEGALRWRLGAAAWFAAALGFAWRLDLMVAGVVRAGLRALGGYEDRRMFQAAALLVGVGAIAWLWARLLPPAGHEASRPDSERFFLLAGGGVLVLLLLRMGSLHQIDQLLAERFLVASVGRWIEAVLVAIALCCVAYRLPRH